MFDTFNAVTYTIPDNYAIVGKQSSDVFHSSNKKGAQKPLSNYLHFIRLCDFAVHQVRLFSRRIYRCFISVTLDSNFSRF